MKCDKERQLCNPTNHSQPFEGPGHNQSMSNFGLFFYFCSDLPNFWHVSYKFIGKHFSLFFSLVFS